ncbi:MAG TPA: MarR family transcriptional regulator [Pyrinomonadaceae bacterium]|jgi:DNA-binding MarR family transcriptional regulator
MAEIAPEKVADVLDAFGEAMSRLMVDQLQKHLAELDLTLPQVQVLRILHRGGTVPTGKLAQCLKISPPATSQLTDRLIRKGLIERRPSEDDRRTVLVALSDAGRCLIDRFRERRNAVFVAALSQLSEAEQAQVVSSLQKVIAALASFEAKT